jgi:hypothetical protein
MSFKGLPKGLSRPLRSLLKALKRPSKNLSKLFKGLPFKRPQVRRRDSPHVFGSLLGLRCPVFSLAPQEISLNISLL